MVAMLGAYFIHMAWVFSAMFSAIVFLDGFVFAMLDAFLAFFALVLGAMFNAIMLGNFVVLGAVIQIDRRGGRGCLCRFGCGRCAGCRRRRYGHRLGCCCWLWTGRFAAAEDEHAG